jgi:hypothetical protein
MLFSCGKAILLIDSNLYISYNNCAFYTKDSVQTVRVKINIWIRGAGMGERFGKGRQLDRDESEFKLTFTSENELEYDDGPGSKTPPEVSGIRWVKVFDVKGSGRYKLRVTSKGKRVVLYCFTTNEYHEIPANGSLESELPVGGPAIGIR